MSRTEFPTDLPVHSRFNSSSPEIRSEISLPSGEHEVYQDLANEEQDRF